MNVLNEIKTAISEAVTNAIVHGYKNDATKLVEMDMYIDSEELTIVVKDYGVGIEDVEVAKQPMYSTKESEDRAGLGFTIMEVFTDELVVESKLNEYTIVTMKKRYHEE